MAFETISGATQTYLGNLKKGEKYVGYLKGVTSKPNDWGGKSYSLICVNPVTGEDTEVLCGGSAKYAAQALAKAIGQEPTDGKEEAKQIGEMALMKQCVGYLVEITSTGEYLNKRKQTVKTYSFARDPEKLLLDAKFTPVDNSKLDEINF